MRTVLLFLLLAALAAFAGHPSTAASNTGHSSDLWGTAGEKWTPQGRLPDFSFAGYHAGEALIPDVPVKASVNDFGAKGDGVTDDTPAFKNAMAAATGGAIFIPAGRYQVTDALAIQKSGIVLRGAGEGQTTLCFTFWNLRSLKRNFPGNRKPDEFPQMNADGLDKWSAEKTEASAWIEQWPGETTLPPHLYEAQKTRRFLSRRE